MPDKLLPPRKRDWKKGTPQIGLFLRTREGGTIEYVRDRATDADEALILALMGGAEKLPAAVVEAVREAWKKNTERKKAG